MFKKLLSVLLAAALLILPAALAEGAADLFVPQKMTDTVLSAGQTLCANLTNITEEERQALSDTLRLSEVNSMNDPSPCLFLDNADWTLELGFYYNELPETFDPQQPADMVQLTISKTLDDRARSAAQVMLIMALGAMDNALNTNNLLAWFSQAKSGDAFALSEGYGLGYLETEDALIYAVLNPTQTGLAPMTEFAFDPHLVDLEGFSLTLNRIAPVQHSETQAALRFHFTAENRMGRSVDLYIENASLNGTQPRSFGKLHMNDESVTEDFFFMDSNRCADPAAVVAAVTNPETTEFTLVLRDSLTHEVLHTQTFSLNLAEQK